jgi:hypothetical protein
MDKFRIQWTREQWFYAEIEADNEDHAITKFWEGEYTNEQMFGSEIQDGIDVRKVEN